jgi:Rap guanine nucleotide exchange factor 1
MIAVFVDCVFSNYAIKKNPKVIGFFNNFDNYISEESLWQISEQLKPRGSAQKKQS